MRTNGSSGAIASARDLRLHREHDCVDGAERLRSRIELSPRAGKRLQICRDGCGSSTATLRGIETEPQPAFEHGGAHLAGADQDQTAGEIA